MPSDNAKLTIRVDFKRMLVNRANDLQDLIRAGGLAVVEKEIANHSLVFGVWQDESQADGVGCVIVKGESVLQIVAGLEATFTLNMKCTAIPCICAEQARALWLTLGDGRPIKPPE